MKREANYGFTGFSVDLVFELSVVTFKNILSSEWMPFHMYTKLLFILQERMTYYLFVVHICSNGKSDIWL